MSGCSKNVSAHHMIFLPADGTVQTQSAEEDLVKTVFIAPLKTEVVFYRESKKGS